MKHTKGWIPNQYSAPKVEIMHWIIYFLQTTKEEHALLHAAEVGDAQTVAHILDNHPGIDTAVTDMMGRTPLRLATQGEHLEVQ